LIQHKKYKVIVNFIKANSLGNPFYLNDNTSNKRARKMYFGGKEGMKRIAGYTINKATSKSFATS
jgi:hypothetical protein